MAALLSQEKIPRNLIDTAIRMAESVADELTRGDDREVCIINNLILKCQFKLTNNIVQCQILSIGMPRRIARITTSTFDS